MPFHNHHGLVMRKQKASNRRTRRKQQMGEESASTTMLSSRRSIIGATTAVQPASSSWGYSYKAKQVTATTSPEPRRGGRGSTDGIQMDPLIREAILSTHAFTDRNSPLRGDPEVCRLDELVRALNNLPAISSSLNAFVLCVSSGWLDLQSYQLSRPPMGTSAKLAGQVMAHMASQFPYEFNAPQRTAIEAALTRRMTLIQGPPGTVRSKSMRTGKMGLTVIVWKM